MSLLKHKNTILHAKQEKESNICVRLGYSQSPFVITQQADDPMDFFFPTLILKMDSYIISHQIKISEILPGFGNFYLFLVNLPRQADCLQK